MEQKKSLRAILFRLIFLVLVLLFSSLSTQLWGGKSEKIEEPRTLTIHEDMTLAEFGEVNQLPDSVIKSVLGLTTKEDLQKKWKDCGISRSGPSSLPRRVLHRGDCRNARTLSQRSKNEGPPGA